MAEALMPPASRKINRSCQECTRRKVKCDGGHPCAACTHNQTAETCEYGSGVAVMPSAGAPWQRPLSSFKSNQAHWRPIVASLACFFPDSQ